MARGGGCAVARVPRPDRPAADPGAKPATGAQRRWRGGWRFFFFLIGFLKEGVRGCVDLCFCVPGGVLCVSGSIQLLIQLSIQTSIQVALHQPCSLCTVFCLLKFPSNSLFNDCMCFTHDWLHRSNCTHFSRASTGWVSPVQRRLLFRMWSTMPTRPTLCTSRSARCR